MNAPAIWPDWYRGDRVRGTSQGITGREGVVISDKPFESLFGHKWVDVQWEDRGKEQQSVRTHLLELIHRPGKAAKKVDPTYTEETSPQAVEQGYDDDYDPRG